MSEPVEGACVLTDGARQSRGYGTVRRDGKLVLAHRDAYEHAYGPIGPGLQIHHRCGVRRCVNPEHLEALTPREHSRRDRSKLSEPARRAIEQSSDTGRVLAARYGISIRRALQIRKEGRDARVSV